MKQKTAIQKISTSLLLLVFALSITPKTFLHDLVANHKDFSACRQVHTKAVFHTQGYNCHFDDLVVSAPFLLQQQPKMVQLKPCFKKTEMPFRPFFIQFFFQHKENRGPPLT